MGLNAQQKQYYLICYDITENRMRSRVVKILQNYGIRVQKSVFEAYINQVLLQDLVKELAPYIDEFDSLRIYQLSKQSYQKVIMLGREDYYQPDEDEII